jgi:hypothetical protein
MHPQGGCSLALEGTVLLRHLVHEHRGQRDIAIYVRLLEVEIISLRMDVFDREIGSHSCDMAGPFFASCFMRLHLAYAFKRSFIIGLCSTQPIFHE